MDGDRVGHDRRFRAAVLQGDEAAWRTWYDATADGLRAYVHWRLAGLTDLADEVVQETWLIAVRRVRSFRPEVGPFAGWLCGIAANIIRNHLRQRRLPSRVPVAACHGPVDIGRPAGDETAEQVARALADLPPHYEQVLRAKYLEGLSVQAIADRSGDSPKAVESLLTRARLAFREAYLLAELRDG
jgi:RNA polymerase sigma-70 factor (ECF subfamily)